MIYGYSSHNIPKKRKKETHSEVAAVFKLSGSALAKPDKSASVRVSTQKAPPKLMPSSPCFSCLLFSLCSSEAGVGEGVGLMEGKGGGEGSNMRNVFAPKAKCRGEPLKILGADRW